MFRYHERAEGDYFRQGYVYFVSHNYRSLTEREREAIRALCRKAGGEHYRALLRYMTSGDTTEQVCRKYYISRATLHRCVARYCRDFPPSLGRVTEK